MFLQHTAMGAAGLTLGGSATVAAAEGDRRATIFGYAACSWSLRDASPKVFDVAKEIGLEGVQLSMAGEPPKLALADAAVRKEYKAASAKTGVKICSLALGCLNSYPLKSDKRAPGWVVQAIDAAVDFGVDIVLLAFFGKGELKTQAEMDRVGDILKEIAPVAAKKKVRLGLENTISAEQTLGIIKRSDSPAVVVYYDVGNARHWKHDAIAELRMLGRRVCEIHFKDGIKSYGDTLLGEGKVDYKAVAAVLHETRYKGWIVLEPHAKDLVPDMKKNLAFARKTMA